MAITVKEVLASALLQSSTDSAGNTTAASSSNASRLIATTVYSFGPAGTTFSAPVVVCVDVNLTEVAAHGWGLSGESDAGGNASLALYWAPSSGNASDGGVTNWTLAAPSTFNEVTGELCGTLWHFTCACCKWLRCHIKHDSPAYPTPPRPDSLQTRRGCVCLRRR